MNTIDGKTTVVSRIRAVDLATGAHSILGSEITTCVGCSPTISDLDFIFGDIAVDDAGNQVVAINSITFGDPFSPLLLTTDLTTGIRSAFFADVRETFGGGGLALDVARNRALTMNHSNHTLSAIDLSTGTITKLTDTEDSANPIGSVGALSHDPEKQIAYLADSNFGAVLAIDTVTGRRVYVSQ